MKIHNQNKQGKKMLFHGFLNINSSLKKPLNQGERPYLKKILLLTRTDFAYAKCL